MTKKLQIYSYFSFIIYLKIILYLVKVSASLIMNEDNIYIFESLKLSNGNFLLLSSSYFYIVDPSFTTTFNKTEISKISHRGHKASFPIEDGGYILFYDYGSYSFIFSKEGLFLN